MSDSVYLRDLDGTGSMHVCAKGDPGAVEYLPVAQVRQRCRICGYNLAITPGRKQHERA